MPLPFTLPDWAPPWAGFAILSVGVLFLLAFLLMPFSVFGLKGRLEALEARLDDIQSDIRTLALRLPEVRRVDWDAEPTLPRSVQPPQHWEEADRRPPIPPPAALDSPPPPPNRRVAPARGSRSEPRFDPS